MSGDGVLVIGAGIGGLSSAITLAAAGIPVTVVDRAHAPGGKMREAMVGGRPVDAGPTVLTMRWVFEALFETAGVSLEDHLTLQPAEVLARHAWGPDQRLDLYADIDRSADAVGALAGAEEARGYRRFCREAEGIYRTLEGTYLTRQQTNPIGLSQRIGFHRPLLLRGLRPFDTLWRALGEHFKDPRLRQLFGRYATYCGSSPFTAPATLMLISHVEREGVWLVDGGMQRLADALERVAVGLGVEVRYGQGARRILLDNGRAAGAELETGETIRARSVIVNAGAEALARGLLGEAAAAAAGASLALPRSLSAVTWALDAPTSGFPLERHNVFFSSDYAREFDEILRLGRLPSDPTIYVCAQDRGTVTTPLASERLLVLINAPPNGDERALGEEELKTCETEVFDRLARSGLRVERRDAPQAVTTPQDFNRLFPGTGGALYGAATSGWSAAFQRPGAATRIAGLYLAGGGAHPGAGVPMAALSGRLAALRAMKDFVSTVPSRRAATRGGMSTPSARTAASD